MTERAAIMANGEYNSEWCEERHRRLDDWIRSNHDETRDRIDTLESRLYGLLVLGVVQLAGIAAILFKIAIE